jgi:hypothetical protein
MAALYLSPQMDYVVWSNWNPLEIISQAGDRIHPTTNDPLLALVEESINPLMYSNSFLPRICLFWIACRIGFHFSYLRGIIIAQCLIREFKINVPDHRLPSG